MCDSLLSTFRFGNLFIYQFLQVSKERRTTKTVAAQCAQTRMEANQQLLLMLSPLSGNDVHSHLAMLMDYRYKYFCSSI